MEPHLQIQGHVQHAYCLAGPSGAGITMARQQLMRKRKLGTVDSPFIHMTDTSRSGYEDSESKRLCTTALNGGKMPRTSEYVHWRVDQVVAYLSSNDFDAKVCAAFKGTKSYFVLLFMLFSSFLSLGCPYTLLYICLACHKGWSLQLVLYSHLRPRSRILTGQIGP